MEARVDAIRQTGAREVVWLLEHPPLYTAGTSAKPKDLVAPDRLPVFKTGRGGQYTYHGPGQQVIYAMMDVKARYGDVRKYVTELESWMRDTLAELGIAADTHKDRVGLWVPVDAHGQHHGPASGLAAASPSQHVTEEKIAAIGVRLKRWVSYHGMSLNIAPDLTHFDGIVPCGISTLGTTSLSKLGVDTDPQQIARSLRQTFEQRFGPTTPGAFPTAGEEGRVGRQAAHDAAPHS